MAAGAGRAGERGLGAETEISSAGDLDSARVRVRRGVLGEPLPFPFVLGVPGGIAANQRSLDVLVDGLAHDLPSNRTWAVAAVGRHELPMVEQTLRRGGHVRVGLEDNLYLERCVYASTADLVERAANIVTLMGAKVIGPDQPREKLGLD